MTLLLTQSEIQPSEVLILRKLIRGDGNLLKLFDFVANSSKFFMNMAVRVNNSIHFLKKIEVTSSSKAEVVQYCRAVVVVSKVGHVYEQLSA